MTKKDLQRRMESDIDSLSNRLCNARDYLERIEVCAQNLNDKKTREFAIMALDAINGVLADMEEREEDV